MNNPRVQLPPGLPSQPFALIQQDISRRIFSATVECRKFLGRKHADLVIVEFDPMFVFLVTCQCAARNERNVMSRIGCCAFMRDNS